MEAVDITDGEAVSRQMKRSRPEVVVHAAGMTDVDACEKDPPGAWAANAGGTRHVAAACAEVGAFLMAISTDYLFDGTAGRLYNEEDLPNPINVYGRSKQEGEQFALALAPQALVVRVSGLFGEGRANFVSAAIRQMRAGEPVPVVTDQVNSPSYTMDLAEGIVGLVERYRQDPTAAEPRGRLHRILHLANTGSASRLEVAERVAGCLGVFPALIRKTTWAALNRPARRPPKSGLDCGRYAGLAGRPLRPWAEAVKAFVEVNPGV